MPILIRITTNLLIIWTLSIGIINTVAYDPASRWGQATVILNDALFVYGGKVDEFNQFSYTSAPSTNDILYLPLNQSFNSENPSWELVSGLSKPTSSQGPPLAWAALTALSSNDVLVFGGQPDANSDIVLVGESDSTRLLDVTNREDPRWRLAEESTFSNEPSRRIHHSVVTMPSGLAFIFGGERADGSRTCLSDNWVFDPSNSSFTEIPSNNGPPTLCGHTAMPLSDGRILVFGGYNSEDESLLPFSTIYVLDTTREPYAWSRLEVSRGALPQPRRAFASTLLDGDRILIHGGSDASLQSNLGDGWTLDFSQIPARWSRVDSLSELGQRRDHFAIEFGGQVIFGFGYGQSGPAPPGLFVFNMGSGTFAPAFTPPLTPVTTRTVPASTPTSNVDSSKLPPSKTRPSDGNTSSPADSNNPDANDPDGNDDDGGEDPKKDNGRKTAAIAASAAVGIILGLTLIIIAFYYRRNRGRKFWDERRFLAVSGGRGNDEDGDRRVLFDNDVDSQREREIPRAGGFENEKDGRVLGLAGIIRAASATIKTRNPREIQERRNMLDDEDNHDFGTWYENRRKNGSTGSSWSLMSFLGRRSRDASAGEPSVSWREKADPFSDPTYDETGAPVAAYANSPPRNRRDASYVSARSALSYHNYTDPFQDPVSDDVRGVPHNDAESIRLVEARSRSPPPLSTAFSGLPLEHTGHALSPVSERTTSQSTLPISSSSHENMDRFSQSTSMTSQNDGAPGSPSLLAGSAMFLSPSPDGATVQRRESWWTRLARRTSLNDAAPSRLNTYTTLRDPNPPPRLLTIDESVHSGSRGSPEKVLHKSSPGVQPPSESRDQRESSQVVIGRHGKSMSSLQTVDSEAIDRMGSAMEVVQRVQSFKRDRHRQSTGSVGELSILEDLEDRGRAGNLVMVNSPAALESQESILGSFPAVPPRASLYSQGHVRMVPTSPTGGMVATRIQTYQRQTSVEAPPSKQAEHVQVNYGLVPRRSLFVANPDHRRSQASNDSSV